MNTIIYSVTKSLSCLHIGKYGQNVRSVKHWTFGVFLLIAAISIQTTAHSQTWPQMGIDIDGEAAGDDFGTSVSMSADGSTLAIGAPDNDGNGTSSGHVRVYSWSGSAWVQKGADIDGETDSQNAGDLSGSSVSLSADGNTVAIGAPRNDGLGFPTYSNAGHVRVYGWSGTAWIQKGADIDGEAAGDWSGNAIDLNPAGDIIAIGAKYNAGNGLRAGHVRVFSFDGANWNQKGADIDGEAVNDESGTSVSISADGNTVVIGAPFNSDAALNAGHIRTYVWSGSAWIKKGNDMDGIMAGDEFGTSVSISNDGITVAVGAPKGDQTGTNSGNARVFDWVGNSLVFSDEFSGESSNNFAGTSVQLSDDGNTLIFGAPGNNTNGGSSGQVNQYRRVGMNWTKVGTSINGEAMSDWSGISVSMSANGDTIAVGAPYNSGNGASAGHVRVFRNNGTSGLPVQVIPVVSYYPNPTNSDINLKVFGPSGSKSITIRNLVGQVVSTYNFSQGNSFVIGLPKVSGLYLINIAFENGASTSFKVMKN